MKLLLTFVLAATAIASGVANAAQYASDADRRAQNREEALTKWRASNGQTANRVAADRPAAQGASLRERTRDGGRSVKNFTERQADTVRKFGERQDKRLEQRFGKRANRNANPAGGGGN